MGCCLSVIAKTSSNIETLDSTSSSSEYDLLRPKGTITVDINNKWNIPVIDINFDGLYKSTIRLWPNNNAQRENFLLLERTPLPSPDVSSLGSSGYDTVVRIYIR